jgi:hypothetical protein
MGSFRTYEAKKKRDLVVLRKTTADRKALVFRHYGGKCLHCGVSDFEVLTIDHINNDGAAHRKRLWDSSGRAIYKYLIENDFPPGYQILCRNCNWKKYLVFLRRIKPNE